MLARASLLAPAARLSHRALFAVPSLRARHFAYGNENKPETKETANEALKDAKAGKTAGEVQQHKATTGGKPLARETGSAGAKATLDNAVRQTQHSTIQPISRETH